MAGLFDPDPDEMDGYVVSTVAGFDQPLKTRALARRQDGDFFGGRTPADRARTREEMIGTDAGAVRALATTVADAVSANAVCVCGTRDILEGAQTALEVIDLLNE